MARWAFRSDTEQREHRPEAGLGSRVIELDVAGGR
jgi:hypothetical protein